MGSNFAEAVTGAMVETRHQWQDLRAALEASYGEEKASLMVCALTHDDPLNDCQGPNWTVAAVAPASCVLLSVLIVRRRRR